jgi:hypothetical protein
MATTIEKPAVATPGRYRVHHLEHGAFIVDSVTSEQKAAEKWLREQFPGSSNDPEWVRLQRLFNMRIVRFADPIGS